MGGNIHHRNLRGNAALPDACHPTHVTRRVSPDACHPTRVTRRVSPDECHPTRVPPVGRSNLKIPFAPRSDGYICMSVLSSDSMINDDILVRHYPPAVVFLLKMLSAQKFNPREPFCHKASISPGCAAVCADERVMRVAGVDNELMTSKFERYI